MLLSHVSIDAGGRRAAFSCVPFIQQNTKIIGIALPQMSSRPHPVQMALRSALAAFSTSRSLSAAGLGIRFSDHSTHCGCGGRGGRL